jgi:hypothetical protein
MKSPSVLSSHWSLLLWRFDFLRLQDRPLSCMSATIRSFEPISCFEQKPDSGSRGLRYGELGSRGP